MYYLSKKEVSVVIRIASPSYPLQALSACPNHSYPSSAPAPKVQPLSPAPRLAIRPSTVPPVPPLQDQTLPSTGCSTCPVQHTPPIRSPPACVPRERDPRLGPLQVQG